MTCSWEILCLSLQIKLPQVDTPSVHLGHSDISNHESFVQGHHDKSNGLSYLMGGITRPPLHAVWMLVI